MILKVFCSTIIPTVGRSTLSRAVRSVLDQKDPSFDFEVVVVNDSGKALPEANWQLSDQVQIIDTNQRERSVARNTGAAMAKGKYLHFLDDDDWLLPGAWKKLSRLAQMNKAGWLYGGTQLIDRDENPTIKLVHKLSGNCFVHALAGEWIPLQSSLVEADLFFQVGGFIPQLAGPEDVDLLRRVTLRSDVAGIQDLVACVALGEMGSTTDYQKHAEQSRGAREAILDDPKVFTRMRSSANYSYWHGRILRAYLTSAVWNLQNKRPVKALGRTWFLVYAARLVGSNIFSREFWLAVAKPHASEAFARGLAESAAETNPKVVHSPKVHEGVVS